MLNGIEILYIKEEKLFNGADTFGRLSSNMELFAHAINLTIKEKFPEVFGMTEEEYEEVSRDVQDWLITDEAQDLTRDFQLEALANIAIEATKTMFQLTGDKDAVSKAYNQILLEGLGVDNENKSSKEDS